MKKWEYKTYDTKRTPSLASRLNMEGEYGWELCGEIGPDDDNDYCTFIFKRIKE